MGNDKIKSKNSTKRDKSRIYTLKKGTWRVQIKIRQFVE